jgi:hypothetical protein
VCQIYGNELGAGWRGRIESPISRATPAEGKQQRAQCKASERARWGSVLSSTLATDGGRRLTSRARPIVIADNKRPLVPQRRRPPLLLLN